MNYCPRCGDHEKLTERKGYIECSNCGATIKPEDILTNVDMAHGRWLDYLHKCANGVLKPPSKEDKVCTNK